MPRPNHDITRTNYDAIQEFATEHDISQQDAHRYLVSCALVHEGLLDTIPPAERLEPSEAAPDNP